MKKKLIVVFTLLLSLGCTSKKPVRNLILVIGDGMGPQQVALLRAFAKFSKKNVLSMEDFVFEKVTKKGNLAVSATEPYDRLVVDSASSATQLAIAAPSRNEMIGLDYNGDPKKTILELSKEKGKAVGIVTDTRLTHATPAAFASHVANRWYEDEIADNMIESNVDVLFSGGTYRFIPKNYQGSLPGHISFRSRRGDSKDLIDIASKKGYQIAHTRSALENVTKTPVLGLFTSGDMPDAIWFSKNRKNPNRQIPNLKEMTEKAVSLLSKEKNGFFLMVESGQIDWAGHQNDAGGMLHELLSFNETASWLVDWVSKRDDTLLVITADHETGSFGFSYNSHERPVAERLPGSAFKKNAFKPNFNYVEAEIIDKMYEQKKTFFLIIKEFEKRPPNKRTARDFKEVFNKYVAFKITDAKAKRILEDWDNQYYDPEHRNLNSKKTPRIEEYTSFFYKPVNNRAALMARAISDQQRVVWGTGGHTSPPVLVGTVGPKYWIGKFNGYLDHPEVGRLMQKALGLE